MTVKKPLVSRGASVAQGVAAGFLFGTSSILIRLLPRLDALSIGFYRLLVATGLILLAALLYRGELRKRFRGISKTVVILGVLIGLHFILFISAVKDTTVLNATVLVSTTPAMALVLSWATTGYRPAVVALAGASVALLGVLVVSLAETALSPGNLAGDFEALLAAFLWAVYLLMGKSVRERFSVVILMPPVYFFAFLVIGAVGLLVGNPPVQPVGEEWVALVALGLLPTALGHTLHFSSLKHLRPYETSLLSLLEPVAASVLAAALLLEIPNPLFYLGSALVLLGVYFTLR